MKFSEYKYERPDMNKFETEFNHLLKDFENAGSGEEQIEFIKKINKKRGDFSTMASIATVRHSIDTTDKFYDGENNFFDENGPIVDGLESKYYKSLISSKFRSDLEKKFNKQIFNIAELKLKTFKPEILEDLKSENKLTSEYQKLYASAKIMFEGEERNLSQIMPFMQNKDRDMRKKACFAYYGFFSENQDKFQKIYDDLVKIRSGIAKKLGYKSFVELGYDRMMRSDYDAKMVAKFRKQVEEFLVPISTKLHERQGKRIGISPLKFYDTPFEFKTGNPKPHGSADWIINNASKMYSELSSETKEFFNFMVENELMDLVTKKGKRAGGYCTEFINYKAPFIFANFNGTSWDVDVLTHEAGHAFQVYSSVGQELIEYLFPTYEACEIHSMSMEFFTWPWMKLFFEDETNKYKFSHLSGALRFIPGGVVIDEFQHAIYDNPNLTPKERNEAWRDIQKKYLPTIDYDGFEYLENGGGWQRIPHIFNTPFYYIDYTLAQICALQFWKKMHEDKETAWNDYLRLCKAGGSKSFLDLVKDANLTSPFDESCIKSIIGDVESWLGKIDDSQY